jgi:hypothetical protein
VEDEGEKGDCGSREKLGLNCVFLCMAGETVWVFQFVTQVLVGLVCEGAGCALHLQGASMGETGEGVYVSCLCAPARLLFELVSFSAVLPLA